MAREHASMLFNAEWIQFGNIIKISLIDGSVTKLPDFTTDEEVSLKFWLALEASGVGLRSMPVEIKVPTMPEVFPT